MNHEKMMFLFSKIPSKAMRFVLAVPVAVVISVATSIIMFAFCMINVVQDAVNAGGKEDAGAE